jgi:hypothetical protein
MPLTPGSNITTTKSTNTKSTMPLTPGSNIKTTYSSEVRSQKAIERGNKRAQEQAEAIAKELGGKTPTTTPTRYLDLNETASTPNPRPRPVAVEPKHTAASDKAASETITQMNRKGFSN